MGIIDDEMKRLQDVVSGLEDRVRSLEQRQSGESISPGGVRMILIGPPGAGMCPLESKQVGTKGWASDLLSRNFGPRREIALTSFTDCRQGNAGAQDQGEVLVLSLGKSTDFEVILAIGVL